MTTLTHEYAFALRMSAQRVLEHLAALEAEVHDFRALAAVVVYDQPMADMPRLRQHIEAEVRGAMEKTATDA